MTSEGASIPSQAIPFEEAVPPMGGPRPAAPGWTWLSLLIGAAALGASTLLWQKVNGMQEKLALQVQTAQTQAVEARTLSRESQDLVRDAAAKLAVLEARVNEVSLQRGQLDTLMQNLTRSRDETLVVDMESAVRMALQQVHLTGSTEPLVATLQNSIKRIERAMQPRLALLQRAMERDLERLSQASVTDTASLLARLDDVVRLIDSMSVQNAPPSPAHLRQPQRYTTVAENVAITAASPAEWLWWSQWAHKLWSAVQAQSSELLRVSRIDHAEAMLLAPEQSFFLRENLKLQLLNARLAVLARQHDAARADIGSAQAALTKYFDQTSRRTHQAQTVLSQLQTHLRATQQPSLDDTLSALSTAASGL